MNEDTDICYLIIKNSNIKTINLVGMKFIYNLGFL